MDDSVNPVPSIGASKLQAQMKEAQKSTKVLVAEQVASQEEFTEWVDQFAFTPTLMMKKFKEVDEKLKKDVKHEKTEAKQDDPEVQKIEDVDKTAEDFADRNPELDERALRMLKGSIDPEDDIDTIMNKVLKTYPDEYLADEALDFLVSTTPQTSTIGRKMYEARVQLNKLYKREITAGRNMTTEAREFSEKGLGSPTGLRDLYRDITGNPREPAELFEELTKQFNLDEMTIVIKFVLHSLGADMKAKGPSIPRPMLQQLLNGSRSMQSILGVYRFFDSRISLIVGQFNRDELDLPPRLTYDLLAKQFVKMIMERYPSSDKILKLGVMLGIADEELAQIIIFTQYRDAIRAVSPHLFKSEKHRQDMLLALLDTLSELEDMLDEEEEEDDDE